jgi:hypothetical protein
LCNLTNLAANSAANDAAAAATATAGDGKDAPAKVEKQYIKVNQYLFLFLKFIATVMPTIEYDFTVNM